MKLKGSLRLLSLLVASAVIVGIALAPSLACAASPHVVAFGSTFSEQGAAPGYATAITLDTSLRDVTTGAALASSTVVLQSSLDCRAWGNVCVATGAGAGQYSATAIPPIVAESYFRFSVAASPGLGAAVSPVVKIAPVNGAATWDSVVTVKVGPDWGKGASGARIVVPKPETSCSIGSWLMYAAGSTAPAAGGIVECSADGVSFHRAKGSRLYLSASYPPVGHYQGYLFSSYGSFYRLSVTPTDASGPSASPSVIVISPRLLRVSASKAKVKAGKPEILRGYFWPQGPVGAKTAQIEVRRRSRKKWLLVGIYRTVNRARAEYSSAYAYTLRIKKKGVYRYRAITTASTYCLKTVTPYRQFTVY